ncbi:hypothetical protein CAPTEDRAFT_223709 [Capitella teleta]|uniref:DUF1731 domain-containing protein n=1 Tax=Capitella teleta TaxID=283909 RepID=R7UJ87_CAPTE|nr:hypothetical protein CAPTEDRAFT_223709 [Capitella teleta]|eukprot:ELU06270.1 hypothetical protein CAPTEDRAFT_223709 [Capitella teleta]
MRVLIGGGSGFVGTRLRRLLNKAGHQSMVISRQPGENRVSWNDIYRDGLPECDAVVNLSGENIGDPFKRWNEDFKEIVCSSRVDTTQQLVTAITSAKHKPRVWISSSAIGYYPASETAEYTELSAGGSGDFFAELCAEWEEAAKLPAEAGVRHVTLRIGLALGREGGMIPKLIPSFWLGAGGTIGSGKQWFPWVHVEDVANLIKYSLENEEVTGVLNAVAPHAATNADFTKTLARAMWRPAFFPLPGFVVKTVFGEERGLAMLEGQRVIPERTLATGYKFLYPDLESACETFSSILPIST